MKKLKTIPPDVAALIPRMQLEFTKENLGEFSKAILQLKTQLKKCPKIKETDHLKEHPAIFHYFYEATDFYICEYDRINTMFGFAILGGDLEMSEWGYFSLSELTGIAPLNIDYYFAEQSIEAALYTAYPDYYKKPETLLPESLSPKSLSFLSLLMKKMKKKIKRLSIYQKIQSFLTEKRNKINHVSSKDISEDDNDTKVKPQQDEER